MKKNEFFRLLSIMIFLSSQLSINSANAESLTSIYCKESNDGKILQPIIYKLDGTLNFLPKIPNENIEELKNQQLIVFELRRRGWDDKLYKQSFNTLLNMKYYQQWDYMNKLNGIKKDINELIDLEATNKKVAELFNHPYFERYKSNINAIKLDIAIDTNSKYSNFDYEFFSKNSYESTVFKEEDYKKFGLALSGLVGIQSSFDSYMHCKLARLVEKN